jgi:DNA-3-methyladenine glycosylase II
MPFDADSIEIAVRHLRKQDPVLKSLIRAVGPFTLRTERDGFKMLVSSIISQQISGKAARSIRLRLQGRIAPQRISPEAIAALSIEELRGVGLSHQKAAYLHDLAAKVRAGDVRLQRLSRWTDEEIIEELIQVKGIGVWTAQMFLMFSLGRLDVFPHDDLGIRSAIRNLYGLADLPDKKTSHRIAAPWRPYATIASWYCWRSHEVGKIPMPEKTEFPG